MRAKIAWVSLLALWTMALSGGIAWAGEPAQIPEPTSLALLAAGLGGAALIKFRRRK
jgi:hypothetical protein